MRNADAVTMVFRPCSSGSDPVYDQSLHSGVDWDLHRRVLDPPIPDSECVDPRTLGSAHRRDSWPLSE